jgi:hypothetical protein
MKFIQNKTDNEMKFIQNKTDCESKILDKQIMLAEINLKIQTLSNL